MLRSLVQQLPPDITLVDTFVFDDSFDHGVFQDRYFGGFNKYLSKSEARSFYYNPTLVISFRKTVEVFRAMKISRQPFLLKECFLNLLTISLHFSTHGALLSLCRRDVLGRI